MNVRRRFVWVAILAAMALWLEPRNYAQSSLPVVPGGEGFGMATRAAYGCGSNPSVLRVTNLNDSGSGSLRAALEAGGPRVVVFEISGTIELGSDINVISPCITIAGQTAPSPGIQIKGFGINILTHDVLVQHLRIRPGDGPPYQENTNGHDASIVYGADAYNVVYDHNSLSWAQGKNSLVASVARDAHVSYWRNIISEGLYHAKHVSFIDGQPSSLGVLLKQSYVGVPSYVSMIGNLMAHNSDRNPEVQGPVHLQFVNNVIYDWGKDATNYQWAMLIANDGASDSPPQLSVVGNVFIAGQPPSPFTPLYAVGTWAINEGTRLYLADNKIDSTRQSVSLIQNMSGIDPRVSSPPVPMDGITVRPSSSVESIVLATAGARPADRDAVDRRIVNQVSTRTGTVISSQDQVGGWPSLASNRRTLTLPSSPHVKTPSGYTNLELWLHGFAAAVETAESADLKAPTNLQLWRSF